MDTQAAAIPILTRKVAKAAAPTLRLKVRPICQLATGIWFGSTIRVVGRAVRVTYLASAQAGAHLSKPGRPTFRDRVERRHPQATWVLQPLKRSISTRRHRP